jgi:mannosyltransferase OCH1-like enzyme
MNVWSYWQGHMPEYIKICIETMKRNCENFTLLTPENIFDYIYDCPLDIDKCKFNNPAHLADIYRVAIIFKYGGVWLDCDTIMISPLCSFRNVVSSYNSGFFYSRWNDGRVLNGYFYATKEHPLVEKWLFKINQLIKRNVSKTLWTTFGEKILTPLVNSHEFKTIETSRTIFLPINVDKIPWVFFEPFHWSNFVADDTISIGLNNSWFRDHVPNFVNSLEPWEGNGLIHQLLNEMRQNDI